MLFLIVSLYHNVNQLPSSGRSESAPSPTAPPFSCVRRSSSRPSVNSRTATFLLLERHYDFDLYSTITLPWVKMKQCAKFGPDRPSCLDASKENTHAHAHKALRRCKPIQLLDPAKKLTAVIIGLKQCSNYTARLKCLHGAL